MRKIFFSLVFLLSSYALADYSCSTREGDSVQIKSQYPLGTGAKLESKTVAAYYKKYLNVQISALKSIIDPGSKKYLTESTSKGYLFGLRSSNNSVGMMWNLDVSLKSPLKAEGVLTDQSGKEFIFSLDCILTGSPRG